MAEVFETSTDNISLHLKNIYAESELGEEATTEDSLVVRQEGARQVRRKVKHYNLTPSSRSVTASAPSVRWPSAIGPPAPCASTHPGLHPQSPALRGQCPRAGGRAATGEEGGTKPLSCWPIPAADWWISSPAMRRPSAAATLRRGDCWPSRVRSAAACCPLQLRPARRWHGSRPTIARGEATDLFARERNDAFAALLGNLTRPCSASRPTRAWRPRRRTCSTSSSRTIRSRTATSAAEPSCSSTPQPQRPPAG